MACGWHRCDRVPSRRPAIHAIRRAIHTTDAVTCWRCAADRHVRPRPRRRRLFGDRFAARASEERLPLCWMALTECALDPRSRERRRPGPRRSIFVAMAFGAIAFGVPSFMWNGRGVPSKARRAAAGAPRRASATAAPRPPAPFLTEHNVFDSGSYCFAGCLACSAALFWRALFSVSARTPCRWEVAPLRAEMDGMAPWSPRCRSEARQHTRFPPLLSHRHGTEFSLSRLC